MVLTRFRPAILPWFGLLMAFVGCGASNGGKLPVHPVSGRVTVGGQPAAGVSIVLNPVEGTPAAKKGLTPSGVTDAEGGVVISTYQQSDGAPAGEYRVTLQWMQPEPPRPNGPPPGFSPIRDKLEGKYRDAAKSAWITKIEEGNNVLEHFSID